MKSLAKLKLNKTIYVDEDFAVWEDVIPDSYYHIYKKGTIIYLQNSDEETCKYIGLNSKGFKIAEFDSIMDIIEDDLLEVKISTTEFENILKKELLEY